MKIPFLLLFALIVSQCNAQVIPPNSGEYPAITREQRDLILANLFYYGQDALRVDHLSDVVKKAEQGAPLTAKETEGMRLILKRLEAEQEEQRAYRRKVSIDEQKATEQREAEAARYREMAQHDQELAAARAAELDRKAFEQSFEAISNPTDAKNFRYIYANRPDPDGLLRKAEARGYSQGVLAAQHCISRARESIAQQKAIAAEVGYVDKNVMYQAGAMLVRCKQNLAEWSKKSSR